ncbi:MAG: hypothetical protein QXU88_02240 [Candidatus Woesearchaeota archaeon]
MTNALESWIKELEKRVAEIGPKEIEKIQVFVRRCPRCKQLSLEFDPNTGIIRCSRCGFEYKLVMGKQ